MRKAGEKKETRKEEEKRKKTRMKDCKRARARGASTEKGVNATDKKRESGPGDRETEGKRKEAHWRKTWSWRK